MIPTHITNLVKELKSKNEVKSLICRGTLIGIGYALESKEINAHNSADVLRLINEALKEKND